MAAIGGSIKEVTLDSRPYKPAADDDAKIMLGGDSIEVVPNGDGSTVIVVTVKPGNVEGVNVAVDHDKGDMEALQGVADGRKFVPFSITLADDTTWQGRAIILDMPPLSTKSARAELKLGFDGKLTRQ